MSTDTAAASARLTHGVSRPRPEVEESPAAPGIEREELTEPRTAGAPGSALLGIYERIEQAEAEVPLVLDLMVPRMRGVGVRYRPMGSVEMGSIERRITAKGSRVPKDRQQLYVNATSLAQACLGVFITDEHGEPVGDPESWVKPGPALVRELRSTEAEMPTAADSIIGLYRTEGDLMAASLELLQWSAEDSTKREDLDLGD